MPGAEYIEAIVLGIVQGIAEFLPISSSGHLVILQEPLSRWLGTPADETGNLQLYVALHFGTLLSILVVYRDDLKQLVRKPRLCIAIVLATIPVVIVGFGFKDALEEAFATPLLAGCMLLVTAFLLLLGQRMERGDRSCDEISLLQAVAIGLFQAVAIVPGISRSGSTIAGGLVVGLRRDAAATFSFFIAIPAISGAVVLHLAEAVTKGEWGETSVSALLVGAGTSFVVGYFALRWLLRIVSQRRLHWFAYYCGLAAAATIIWKVIERSQAGL